MAVFRGIQRMRLKYILFIFCSVGLLVFMYFNQGSKKDPNFNQQSPASIINPSKLYEGKVQSKVSKEPRVNNGLFGNTNTKGLLAEETEESPWYKQEPDKVKVVVVEEHHEVLKYWFEAVEAGIIPKTGNTLLHIDGHSDGAPPMYLDGYPLYRPPVNKEELTIMLQRNDAFIVQASMAGLLDRVIWVWPQWDAVNHDTVYRQWIVELGTTEVKIDGYLTKVFCICHLEGNDTEFDCRYLNEEDANDVGYMGTKIDKDKCKRPTKRGIFEELQEDNALEKLKGGHWFKDNENIILDIDEDYFGCESGTDSLINAKIPWKLIEEINKLLNELICIKVTEHEKLADRLLYNHINSFRSLCSQTGKCDLTKALKLLEDEVAKLPRQILCHGRNKQMVKQICLMINNKIARLSKTQMNTLQETGFCAQTTVKSFTHLLENENRFKVCHGVNAPNQSVVIFHSPTIEETNTRITLLGDLLGDKHLPKPKLVTLCRSMRDGYTPKSQYHKIEKGIIDSVINSHKNSFAVYYDKDLLGGQKGWPGRHSGK